MAYSFTEKKRIRKNFGKQPGILDTPYLLAEHLWGGRLDYHQRRFAMVESAAHLVRLVALGRAREVAPFRFAPV